MPFLLQLIMLMHGLLTFIEHHKIRALRFASRQRQETAGIHIPKHPDAILCASQWVMVVKLVGLIDEYRISNSSSSSCLVCYGLLSLLACLGCTERSVRLASTTITSTPTSVNDVEVRWISKTKGEYCYGRAIQCQLFM